MKRTVLILITSFVLSGIFISSVTGQVRQERHQTKERQIQLDELASQEIQNLFQEPLHGTVYGKEGKLSALMNYNVLLDVFFVMDNGSKSWVKPEESDSIRFGDYLFYFYPQVGYFEVISKPEEELVLRRHMMDISAQTVAVGAYGTPSQVASTEAVRSIHDSSEFESVHQAAMMRNPGGEELHITLRREEAFFMVSGSEPVSINSRRALRREFPDHGRDLVRYVRRNNIDFKETEEMVQLAEYIRSLLDE